MHESEKEAYLRKYNSDGKKRNNMGAPILHSYSTHKIKKKYLQPFLTVC